MTLYDRILQISAALERAGVPPLSPFWRSQAERFYGHLTALLLVACVGRGGDKSRTSVIMAIAETLFGEYAIPLGELHYFVHVAENKDEAAKTLAILEQYLRILNVPFTRSGDTIDLTDLPRGIRVLACRIGAVSGFRCFGWTADENAKWDDDGADPSAEVIASIRAMTVTHPNARGRIISSPVATLGHFYETWSQGDTADQVAAHAPSWVANPSITEEQTHKLEREPKRHAREYCAVPAEGTEDALYEAALIDRARRKIPGDIPPAAGHIYVSGTDPGITRNSWTFCIACVRFVEGRTKASIVLAREWTPPRGGRLEPASVLANIAKLARPYGVTSILTDQFHGESLASLATSLGLGIALVVDKPTVPEKLTRYESVLTRLMDDEIDLPHDLQLRADMLAVRRRVMKGGNGWTIHMAVDASGRHADYAPSVVLCLSQIQRITQQAAAFEARTRYLDAYFSGDLMREQELADAIDPNRFVHAARRRARLDGSLKRDLEAYDELLRRTGSPAWSGYQKEEGK